MGCKGQPRKPMGEKIVGSHFMWERTERGPVDLGVGGSGFAKNLGEIILILKCDDKHFRYE